MSGGVRVVLTGAASGIGAAALEALRARGARVVGLDLRADAARGILAADVRDQASVDRAVAEAVAALGGLDVLINCAGVGDVQSVGERPGEDVQRVLDVNLLGPWRVTAAALPALRAARGRVVNVASGLSFLTMPLAAAYCMSKRGLVAFSDALRLEHGDALRVTTVYPGYVRTPIHHGPATRGVRLEGLVPVETVEDAARTLVRAALGRRPPRDLATSRFGTFLFALLRILPPAWVDGWMGIELRRAAARGHFDAPGMASELKQRLLTPP